MVADRRLKFADYRPVDFVRIERLATNEALDETIRAVELDDLFIGDAGQAVKAVDVLRDETEQLVALFEIPDRIVTDVRLYFLVKIVGLLLELPVPDPCGFAGHEFIEIDRLILRPDSSGTSEIRDTGFRADAGAGEKDDIRCLV